MPKKKIIKTLPQVDVKFREIFQFDSGIYGLSFEGHLYKIVATTYYKTKGA